MFCYILYCKYIWAYEVFLYLQSFYSAIQHLAACLINSVFSVQCSVKCEQIVYVTTLCTFHRHAGLFTWNL